MGMIKHFFGKHLTKKNLDKCIYCLFLLLAFSVCVSEPFSRHCGKAVIALGLLRLFLYRDDWRLLLNYRRLAAAITAYLAALAAGTLTGGHIWQTLTQDYSVLFNYNALLVPIMILTVREGYKLLKITAAIGLSLIILDGYILWQIMQGNMRPDALSSRGQVALGVFFGILTPMFFVLAAKMKGAWRPLFAILFVAAFFGTIGTGIRSAWLAVIVMLMGAAFFVWHGKWKSIIGGALVMAVTVGVVAFSNANYLNRMQSISDMQQQQVAERFLMWESSFRMFKDQPLFGVGAGNWGDAYQQTYISPNAKEPYQRHAHSDYMQFLAEYGIVGLLGFLTMTVSLTVFAWRHRDNPWAAAFFFGHTALMLYAATENPFREYGTIRFYWLVLAIVLSGTGATPTGDKNIIGTKIPQGIVR